MPFPNCIISFMNCVQCTLSRPALEYNCSLMLFFFHFCYFGITRMFITHQVLFSLLPIYIFSISYVHTMSTRHNRSSTVCSLPLDYLSLLPINMEIGTKIMQICKLYTES